eukprot:TRINITY_DN7187_c0_g1_i2.p1 TRINITY_DN7187_c0_g1~~TRINITY_DN7187_c0_g1_i2.p1  ORF type:complete len:251 (-),score=49.72 TRINITY_DN7187_c0_g1_i2:25-777(-)
MVANECNGVDLNCGCPQTWVVKENLGSALMDNPQLIQELVRAASARLADKSEQVPVSVKMRIFYSPEKTVELARRAEHAGARYIAVHGRTQSMKDFDTPNYDMVKLVRESVSIPVIYNGGVQDFEMALKAKQLTGCRGIMVGNGLLRNPALFQGSKTTPAECISEWMTLGQMQNVPFPIYQKHLGAMCHTRLCKTERHHLNSLLSMVDCNQYVQQKLSIEVFVFSFLFKFSQPIPIESFQKNVVHVFNKA